MAEPIKQPQQNPYVGMYKNLRGQKIFNAAGYALKSVDGYFNPKTDEEKALCAYYESIGHLAKVK